MPTPESYLHARGLEPLSWDEVLRRVEARLGGDNADTFARLHRAFTAYPAEHTCRAFYDFAARRDLHGLLACYRFDRLTSVAEALTDLTLRGARVLDWGAGGGFLTGWLRDGRGAEVFAADLSPATVVALAQQDFPSPRSGQKADDERFDIILCADSLGEIHADEDDWLSDEGHTDDGDYCGEIEARYGFAQKLSALEPLLAPRGAVLLFEPVALEHFWRGAAQLLEANGWRVEARGPAPAWHLRLQRQIRPRDEERSSLSLGRWPG
jgi:hypothetical protein